MKFKLYYIFVLLLTAYHGSAQKSLDTKIYVTVSDTAGLREKIRLAFTELDFPVKDDGKDTVSTFPRIMRATQMVAFAAPAGNTVVLWGYIGEIGINALGYTTAPGIKDFRKVFYYKKDKYWSVLKQVAEKIGMINSYGQ